MPKIKSKFYIIVDASKHLYGAFEGGKKGKEDAEKYCKYLKKEHNLKVSVKLK